MAAETPYEAYQEHAWPLQQALRCVTEISLDGPGFGPGDINVLTFHGDDVVPLVRSDCQPRMWLTFRQHYRVIEIPSTDGGPWRVNIVGYIYTLHDRDQREIVSYHWHLGQSSPNTYPHLHMGVAAIGEGASVSRRDLPGIHFPTRFIPPQDIIRLAITQFDIRPLRNDWEQILRDTVPS